MTTAILDFEALQIKSEQLLKLLKAESIMQAEIYNSQQTILSCRGTIAAGKTEIAALQKELKPLMGLRVRKPAPVKPPRKTRSDKGSKKAASNKMNDVIPGEDVDFSAGAKK